MFLTKKITPSKIYLLNKCSRGVEENELLRFLVVERLVFFLSLLVKGFLISYCEMKCVLNGARGYFPRYLRELGINPTNLKTQIVVLNQTTIVEDVFHDLECHAIFLNQKRNENASSKKKTSSSLLTLQLHTSSEIVLLSY